MRINGRFLLTGSANPLLLRTVSAYTQTYLERDLRDLAAVDSLVDFQRLMRAICLRVGTVLNQVELARDTPTITRNAQQPHYSFQL